MAANMSDVGETSIPALVNTETLGLSPVITSALKFDCDYCDKKLKTKQTLKSHMKSLHFVNEDTPMMKRARNMFEKTPNLKLTKQVVNRSVQDLDIENEVMEEAKEDQDLAEMVVSQEPTGIRIGQCKNQIPKNAGLNNSWTEGENDKNKEDNNSPCPDCLMLVVEKGEVEDILQKEIAEKKQIQKKLEDAQKKMTEYSDLLDSATKANVVLKDKLDNITSRAENQEAVEEDETALKNCNQCDFVAKTGQELAGHMKFEHLRCKDCNECFLSDKALKIHNSKMHSIELHQCFPCKLIFPNKIGRDVHIKKKHSEKITHKCTLCKDVFKTQDGMLSHIKDKHTEDDTNKSQWQCPVCDNTYNSENELVKHIDNVHFEKEVSSTNENNSNKACRNGLNCRFLKENRCMFYHDVAAQVGEWREVSHHRKGKETWTKGRNGSSYRVHPITVKLCINGDSCDKGKRLPNGRMWNCAFRHNKSDFQGYSGNKSK